MLPLFIFFAYFSFANADTKTTANDEDNYSITYGLKSNKKELSFIVLRGANRLVTRRFAKEAGYLEIFERKKDHTLFIHFVCSDTFCSRSSTKLFKELKLFDEEKLAASDSADLKPSSCGVQGSIGVKNRNDNSKLVDAVFSTQSEEAIECDSESQIELSEAVEYFLRVSNEEEVRACVMKANPDYDIYFAELEKITNSGPFPKILCDYRPTEKRNAFRLFPENIILAAPLPGDRCAKEKTSSILGHEWSHRSRPGGEKGVEVIAAKTQDCYYMSEECMIEKSSKSSALGAVALVEQSKAGSEPLVIQASDRIIPADPPSYSDTKTFVPSKAGMLWGLAESEARAIPYTYRDTKYGTGVPPIQAGDRNNWPQATLQAPIKGSSRPNLRTGGTPKLPENELRASEHLIANVNGATPLKAADLTALSNKFENSGRGTKQLEANLEQRNNTKDDAIASAGRTLSSKLADGTATAPAGVQTKQAPLSVAQTTQIASSGALRQPASADSKIAIPDSEIEKWNILLAQASTRQQLASLSKVLAAKKVNLQLNERQKIIWGTPAIGLQQGKSTVVLFQDRQGKIRRLPSSSKL